MPTGIRNEPITLTCLKCGIKFITCANRQKYCSIKCGHRVEISKRGDKYRQYMRRWREANKDRLNAKQRENWRIKHPLEKHCKRCGKEFIATNANGKYCWKCKPRQLSENTSKFNNNKKNKAFSPYSKDGISRCNCCGITDIRILEGHHIDRNKKEMKQSAVQFYKWIIENRWPDDIEVLCANCHRTRHTNSGICSWHEVINVL